MNDFGLFVIEWIAAFIVVFVLNYCAKWLLRKKFSPMTTAILAFIIVGLILFLTAPYVITSVTPELVFLPFLVLFLIIDVYRATKKST